MTAFTRLAGHRSPLPRFAANASTAQPSPGLNALVDEIGDTLEPALPADWNPECADWSVRSRALHDTAGVTAWGAPVPDAGTRAGPNRLPEIGRQGVVSEML